jgi:hypothetical protein
MASSRDSLRAPRRPLHPKATMAAHEMDRMPNYKPLWELCRHQDYRCLEKVGSCLRGNEDMGKSEPFPPKWVLAQASPFQDPPRVLDCTGSWAHASLQLLRHAAYNLAQFSRALKPNPTGRGPPLLTAPMPSSRHAAAPSH